jgi:hypothetical protein
VLPESFKALYRIQNGGPIQDVVSPDSLFPIDEASEPDFEHISTLRWQCEQADLNESVVEWIEAEFGDPSRILTLNDDGCVYYALDYNCPDAAGEPRVIRLDLECLSAEVIAPSFRAWIDRLMASDAECAVDWEAIQQHPILFHETIARTTLEEGRPSETESVIACENDDCLLFATRVRSGGRIIEVEQASFPKGIAARSLEIEAFGPASNRTFALHLHPVDTVDIHWIACQRTARNTWKNERSSRVPAYAELESKSEEALNDLVDQLRRTGLVHGLTGNLFRRVLQIFRK